MVLIIFREENNIYIFLKDARNESKVSIYIKIIMWHIIVGSTWKILCGIKRALHGIPPIRYPSTPHFLKTKHTDRTLLTLAS